MLVLSIVFLLWALLMVGTLALTLELTTRQHHWNRLFNVIGIGLHSEIL
jgi:hypothetical protein